MRGIKTEVETVFTGKSREAYLGGFRRAIETHGRNSDNPYKNALICIYSKKHGLDDAWDLGFQLGVTLYETASKLERRPNSPEIGK